MKRKKSDKKDIKGAVTKAKYSREDYEVRILSRFIESLTAKVFPDQGEYWYSDDHDIDTIGDLSDDLRCDYRNDLWKWKYIPREFRFPHTSARYEIRDFLTRKWRTRFSPKFYDTLLKAIPAPQGFSEISSMLRILGEGLKGEKHFRESCDLFLMSPGEIERYLKMSVRLIAAAGERNITELEAEIQTLSRMAEKYLKSLIEDLTYSLTELQSAGLVDYRRGKAVFLKTLKNNKFYVSKNKIDHPRKKVAGLDLTERFLRLWQYFLISLADLSIFHERYNELKKILAIHALYFRSEDLAHYVAILCSKGVSPPKEAFASMFVDRGGNDKFSDGKTLGEYCKIKKWKEFGRAEQFALALRGMIELENQDKEWFRNYLSHMNKRSNLLNRGYRNPFLLKYISERHYKAGLFNFNRWAPLDSKLPLPEGHSLKGKYPIFDWHNVGSNPLAESFFEFNRLRVVIKNQIREALGLPLVGDYKQNETRVYKLVQKVFKGFSVIREHSPEFLFPQRYDYYIAKLKVAIEWNGEQHYQPIEYFGGKQGFEAIKERDSRKRRLSARNGIKLVELKYDMTDDDIVCLLESLRRKLGRS